MTESIRADWYDLRDADRTEYLKWLHADFLPAASAVPGVAWIGHYAIVPKSGRPPTPNAPPRRVETDPSVPAGGQYVLLVAASAPDIFVASNSRLSTLEAEASGELARRQKHRQAVFIEECSVGGPSYQECLPGTGAPPAIQLGNLNVERPAEEVELARFYRHFRFPQVIGTKGCIRARKLVSIVGWGKHGVLYEFADMADGEELFEMRFGAATPEGLKRPRHVLEYVTHSPTGPCAGPRIWPGA
jgi:hypothetical protein